MSSDADREIVYTLKPVVDKGAEAAFNKIIDLAEHTSRAIKEKLGEGVAQAAKTTKSAATTAGKDEKQAAAAEKARDKEARAAESAASKSAAAKEREIGREMAAKEAAARRTMMVEARLNRLAEAAEEKKRRAAEKVEEEEKKRQERETKEAEAAAEKKARDAQRSAEKEARDKETAAKRAFEHEASLNRLAEAADAKHQRERKNAIAQAEDDLVHSQERVRLGHEQSREAIMRSVISVNQLARGFVELGLVGEEDAQKVRDGLLQIVGATELVRGGIDAWNAVSEAVQAYRDSIIAAREAEEGLAALQAIRGNATAAEAAAAATGGGGAAGTAATIAGATGGGGGEAVAGAAGGGIIGGLAGMLSLPVAAAAALASSLLALKVVVEQVTGDGNKSGVSGFIANIEEKIGLVDLLHGVGKRMSGMFSSDPLDPYHNENESDDRLKAQQKSSLQSMESRERTRDMATETAKAEAAYRKQQRDEKFQDLEASARGHGYEGDDLTTHTFDAKMRVLQDELKKAESALAAAQTPTDQSDLDAMLKGGGINEEKRDAAAADRKQALEDILALEQKQYDAVARTGAKAIADLKQQLSLQKQQIDAAKKLLETMGGERKSDAARFADLSPEEKAATLKAMKDAKDGKDLTKEQSDLLGQFTFGRQISQDNRAKQGEKEAADMGRSLGLDNPFQSFHGKRIDDQKEEIKRLEKLEIETTGRIDFNITETDKAKGKLEASMGGHRNELRQIAKEEFDKLMKDLPAKINQAIEQKYRALRTAQAAK